MPKEESHFNNKGLTNTYGVFKTDKALLRATHDTKCIFKE